MCMLNMIVTLWLLLAVTKGLFSQAGESRVASMLSSADSGLQQQVHFHKKTSLLFIHLLLKKVECYPKTAAIKWKMKTSPCLILTCESVRTVNEEVENYLESKRISHTVDSITYS